MAEISFSVNEQVTSAKMNTLCDQLVTTCTSGTRPGSPVDGQHIYETDTKRKYVYDSTAGVWYCPNAFVRISMGTTNQAITTGTLTSVAWAGGSDDIDNYGFYNGGSDTTKFTVPTGYAGIYLVTANVEWASTSAQGSFRELRLLKNGTCFASVVGQATSSSGPNYYARQSVAAAVQLAAGDYVQAQVAHDIGSNLNINGTSSGQFPGQMSMSRINAS